MALWGGSTTELPSGVLTSAISSGSLALIRDADLTTTLAAWPGRVENIRERAQVMREQEAAFTEHLVQHREVATVLPVAVSEISAVIASGQLGRPVVEAEEALALLRSIKGDSLAMRRLSVKLWMTTLYVGQLKVLERDLRAIEDDLSGTGRTPPS